MKPVRGGRIISSFSIDPTEENQAVLQELRMLGAKDGMNFSEMVREAIMEYVKRHSPGNPQLILGHWNMNLPLPETIREKKVVASSGPSETNERWARLNKMSDEDLRKRYSKIRDRAGSGEECMEIMIILKSREKK